MGRGSSKGSGGGGGSSKNVKQDKLTAAAKSDTIKQEEYKSFDDVAVGAYKYGGDPQQTQDFFNNNSNYDALVNQMSKEEREDFESWAIGDFMSGQQYKGWDSLDDYDKAVTKTFDKYLDQATLKKGVQLSRLTDAQIILGSGNKMGTLKQFQAMEGQFIKSKGNMSFSAAGEGLTIGQSKTVELKLKIPGGTTGAGMWIGDKRINPWGANQREFMTNRDIIMRVGKTTYNKKRGVFEVEIFYENRENHDYGTSGN